MEQKSVVRIIRLVCLGVIAISIDMFLEYGNNLSSILATVVALGVMLETRIKFNLSKAPYAREDYASVKFRFTRLDKIVLHPRNLTHLRARVWAKMKLPMRTWTWKCTIESDSPTSGSIKNTYYVAVLKRQYPTNSSLEFFFRACFLFTFQSFFRFNVILIQPA